MARGVWPDRRLEGRRAVNGWGVGSASGRRTAGRGDGRRRTRARHRTGRCRRCKRWRRTGLLWLDAVVDPDLEKGVSDLGRRRRSWSEKIEQISSVGDGVEDGSCVEMAMAGNRWEDERDGGRRSSPVLDRWARWRMRRTGGGLDDGQLSGVMAFLRTGGVAVGDGGRRRARSSVMGGRRC
ncbi:hypothetical protein ACLOJK_041366 [Asimina triloba]